MPTMSLPSSNKEVGPQESWSDRPAETLVGVKRCLNINWAALWRLPEESCHCANATDAAMCNTAPKPASKHLD